MHYPNEISALVLLLKEDYSVGCHGDQISAWQVDSWNIFRGTEYVGGKSSDLKDGAEHRAFVVNFRGKETAFAQPEEAAEFFLSCKNSIKNGS